MSAKIHIQEGNSPDYKLRSISRYLVDKILYNDVYPGGGLGSSHPLKKA